MLVPTASQGASLPVLNLDCYLLGGNPADRPAKAFTLRETLRDIGFFYLDVSGYVRQSEMEEILQAGRDFFARPLEQKEAIAIDGPVGDGSRGYQRLKQNITQGKVDHHEGLDLYARSRQPFDPAVPLSGENQWPVNSAVLRATVEGWQAKMCGLGLAVMEAISDALEQTPDEWEQLHAEGTSCGAHCDYGCLTFLLADNTKGALQVLKRKPWTAGEGDGDSLSDDEWITADPLPSCVVVNIGEMVEVWSAGLFKATLHRVMHLSPTYRVSVPVFFEPAFDAEVAPLPAAERLLKREGRPVKPYPSTLYGEHLLRKVGSNFVGEKKKY